MRRFLKLWLLVFGGSLWGFAVGATLGLGWLVAAFLAAVFLGVIAEGL